eukprot:5277450-Alexandrium_andersonii.AAC.1
MLFQCPYCATHFTVPRTAEDEVGVAPEDLVLAEDCDVMLAAEYERKEAAAPAAAGGDNPTPDAPEPAAPMGSKRA